MNYFLCAPVPIDSRTGTGMFFPRRHFTPHQVTLCSAFYRATPVHRTGTVLASTIWPVWGGTKEEESPLRWPWRGGVTAGQRINVMFGSECVVHHAGNTASGPASALPTSTLYPRRLCSSPLGHFLTLFKWNYGYFTIFLPPKCFKILLDLFPLSFYSMVPYSPSCPAV